MQEPTSGEQSALTGREFLLRARTTPEIVTSLNTDERAALIAVLLSDFTGSDADLLVTLARAESALLADDHVNYGQDPLMACCWMLFMIGRLEDVPVVWEAKMTDFDTGCGIDTVLLLPHGMAPTLDYAVAHHLDDITEWLAQCEGDVDADIQGWRDTTYFDGRPAPDALVEELAAWMRQ